MGIDLLQQRAHFIERAKEIGSGKRRLSIPVIFNDAVAEQAGIPPVPELTKKVYHYYCAVRI